MRTFLLSGLIALALGAAPAAAQTPGDVSGGIAPPTTTQPTPPSTPTTPPPTPPTKPTRGTVPAVLAGELAAGRIDQARHDRYKADYDAALAARETLPLKGGDKLCREQLSTVVKSVEKLARVGQLTPSRMDAVFLELKRNAEFWVKRPAMRSGARTKFGTDSELLFQHYPGEGLRLQPLGNWGKLNGLLSECRAGTKCERAKIRTLLDELVPLASQRAGYTTWEYFFPFGGGQPPWTSGLSQGTAIQALARASEFLGDPKYRELAGKALGAFQQAPPEGVRISSAGGSHYLIYSFAPRLRVLNGFLQAVTGLYDYAQLTGDPIGQELFVAGDTAAQKEVGRYDTGKWSYYALPAKSESTYGYHALVTTFLGNLCSRTKAAPYCGVEAKFKRYLGERPREPERPLGPNLRCGARKA